MNKKKTAITIIVSILLMIIVSCSDMNPFFAGGVVPGGNWIYFAEGSNVKRMRLDGSELESVFSLSYQDTEKIQLDPLRQKIYILSTTEGLHEYDLNGDGKKKIQDDSFPSFYDISIDHINGYLYLITGVPSKRIVRVDTSTYQFDVVYTGSLGLASGASVVLDYMGGVYFIENVDGGSNILNKVASLDTPTYIKSLSNDEKGLCYNKTDGYLYSYGGWTIYNNNNFNKDALVGGLVGGMAIYPLDNTIFFQTDTDDIFRMNLNTKNVVHLYESPMEPIRGFDILSK